jgi:hypothetical protein
MRLWRVRVSTSFGSLEELHAVAGFLFQLCTVVRVCVFVFDECVC